MCICICIYIYMYICIYLQTPTVSSFFRSPAPRRPKDAQMYQKGFKGMLREACMRGFVVFVDNILVRFNIPLPRNTAKDKQRKASLSVPLGALWMIFFIVFSESCFGWFLNGLFDRFGNSFSIMFLNNILKVTYLCKCTLGPNGSMIFEVLEHWILIIFS